MQTFWKNMNFGDFQNNCRVNSEICVFVFTYPYKISVKFHTFFFTFGKVTHSQTFKYKELCVNGSNHVLRSKLKYDFLVTRHIMPLKVAVKDTKLTPFIIVHSVIYIPYLFAVIVGSDCFSKSYFIKEDQTITLEWKGANPDFSGCLYRFNGKDFSDILQEYKVCVETKEFFLQSKGISVKFSSGISNSVVSNVKFQRIC